MMDVIGIKVNCLTVKAAKVKIIYRRKYMTTVGVLGMYVEHEVWWRAVIMQVFYVTYTES